MEMKLDLILFLFDYRLMDQSPLGGAEADTRVDEKKRLSHHHYLSDVHPR